MWKPSGRMDCIDLGKDFYLTRFEDKEDYDKVHKGGPWFIGESFLIIRAWEPNYRPSSTNLSAVALWMRLPELPIEYYDEEALHDIGNAIGPMLRVDVNTFMEKRGRFARICVQVDVDKPLVRTIIIGSKMLQVVYKGVSSMCFSCGQLGHRRMDCRYTPQPPLISPESQKVAEEGVLFENGTGEDDWGCCLWAVDFCHTQETWAEA